MQRFSVFLTEVPLILPLPLITKAILMQDTSLSSYTSSFVVKVDIHNLRCGQVMGGVTLPRLSAFPFCKLLAIEREMEATLAFAVWFLCVCSLGNVKPVYSSHFMGGLIRWRPVNPAVFDGRVSEN